LRLFLRKPLSICESTKKISPSQRHFLHTAGRISCGQAWSAGSFPFFMGLLPYLQISTKWSPSLLSSTVLLLLQLSSKIHQRVALPVVSPVACEFYDHGTLLFHCCIPSSEQCGVLLSHWGKRMYRLFVTFELPPVENHCFVFGPLFYC
jgi:hypothetical protein